MGGRSLACTGALLVLPDGRWVLQRRTDDAPTDPGKLGFFGGQQEEGETAAQCFEREMQEETSIDLKNHPWSLAAEYDLPFRDQYVKVSIFRVDIPVLDFEVYEGTGAEAYTQEELLKRADVAPGVTRAINILTEKNHGT